MQGMLRYFRRALSWGSDMKQCHAPHFLQAVTKAIVTGVTHSSRGLKRSGWGPTAGTDHSEQVQQEDGAAGGCKKHVIEISIDLCGTKATPTFNIYSKSFKALLRLSTCCWRFNSAVTFFNQFPTIGFTIGRLT